MNRALLVAACVAGCGRFGFDGGTASGDRDASNDAQLVQWPNLPADCTVLTDTRLTTVPPAGWGATGSTRTVIDGTAPGGPGMVAQWEWLAGTTSSSVPWQLYHSGIAPTTRDVYLGIVWRPSDPWDGPDSGFSNMFYVHYDDAGMLAISTLTMSGINAPYRLRGSIGATNLLDNVNSPMIELGAWHTVELRIRLSTTRTSADGGYSWWLDGEPIGDYQDRSFDVDRIEAVNIAPNWGGGTNAPKSQTDDFRIDRAIICER